MVHDELFIGSQFDAPELECHPSFGAKMHRSAQPGASSKG